MLCLAIIKRGIDLQDYELTCLTISAQVRPLILAHTFEVAPQLDAPGAVLALVRLARRLAILDDF